MCICRDFNNPTSQAIRSINLCNRRLYRDRDRTMKKWKGFDTINVQQHGQMKGQL